MEMVHHAGKPCLLQRRDGMFAGIAVEVPDYQGAD
jgi:hypothetical protein